MQPRTEQSKLRRWLRRGLKCLIGLVFLSAGALVLADVWHQWVLNREVGELREVISRVETEVQGGVPAAEWHESRVSGRNGWVHVAFLWDAYRVARDEDDGFPTFRSEEGSRDLQLWSAITQLADYSQGEWHEQEPEDAPRGFTPRSVPTNNELSALLKSTDVVPEALLKAGGCDVVTPVPRPDAPKQNWYQRLPSYPWMYLSRAMIGRAMALRELGHIAKADEELVTSIAFWSMYRLPLNYRDALSSPLGALLCIFDYCDRLASQKLLAPQIAKRILGYTVDGDALLLEALRGDVVCDALTVTRDPNALQDARWFEWLSREESNIYGWGASGFGYRAGECDPIRIGILRGLQSLETLTHPVDVSQLPTIPGDYYFAITAEALPDCSMNFRQINVVWLALKLRVMEIEYGPLSDQKARVEAEISLHEFADFEWRKNVLVLFPVPQAGLTNDSASWKKRALDGYYTVELHPAKLAK